MCNCSGRKAVVVTPQFKTLSMRVDAAPMGDNMEEVTVTGGLKGFYTVDSGHKYKSMGIGTMWTIFKEDRSALEKLGLIAPIS